MKLFESTHLFQHSWDNVTSAIWRKYPNERAPHVLHIETIDQYVEPETGVLVLERLIIAKDKMPGIISRLMGGEEHHYVREVTRVDPKQQTFKAVSKNLTFNHLMSIQETVRYGQCKEDPMKTVFIQEAQITAEGSLKRFANYVEELCVNGFREKAESGRRAMEQVLEVFMQERQTTSSTS